MSEKKVLIYDKALNHFKGNGNFPNDLPIEQAYVHIGMFLGWIIEQALYSDFFEEECGAQILKFLRKDISPTVLSEIWDGHLGSDLFTDEGNMFTYYYYGGGIFSKDYRDLLVKDLPSVYHVQDSWANYQIMSDKITERYFEWRKIIKD